MARILHIEDDAGNRLLVRKLLTSSGHEILEAADGIEGVRMARAERPDLILVDLDIPGLDGYEVTLRLRGEASLRDVPIVAITAEGDRQTSLAVGADGFLQKPIDARSFARTISSFLGGKRESMSPKESSPYLRAQGQRIALHLESKIAELMAANERLLELDRARKAFYRNISHELATPMTPIVGYLKLLSDEELGPLNPAQRKALRTMDECVRRLRGLIDNLLDVTGLETGRMSFLHRDYDFLDTARRAVARMADTFAERGLSLVEEFPVGPLPAWGDAERLSRAMLQLLDNAAKFTPSGGQIGVRVRVLPTAHYEFCVADTGPGVPMDQVDRLFDAFVQLDGSPTREHGGVGVGLAIAQRVGRGLGGDLRVQSPAREVIGGTSFEGAAFYLTVAQRAPSTVGGSTGGTSP